MIDQSFVGKEEKIVALRDKIKKAGNYGRTVLEKQWYKNVLFYVGIQWIMWYESKRSWQNIDYKEMPKHVPRPVVNKYARTADTMKSLLVQKDPRIIVRPADDTEEAMATAQMGDDLVDVTDSEADMKTARKVAASWLVLNGNFFYCNYYHLSHDYGTTKIQFERCNACSKVVSPKEMEGNTCPYCGAPDSMGPAIDEKAQPIGVELPKGKLCTDVASPFEMFFDQSVEDFKKVKSVVRSKETDIEEIKATYPDFVDNIVSNEKDTGEGSNAMEMKSALAYITSQALSGQFGGKGKPSPTGVLDYVHHLPDNDFPQGLLATVNGNTVLEAIPLAEAYSDQDENPFIPIVHCPKKRVPGRIWGKTEMDDLGWVQVSFNSLLSFIELCNYRMAAPDWLIPEGCEVDQLTGEPGLKVTWKNISGQPNIKPERLDGKEIPQSIKWYLEKLESFFEDLGASYDVLKGDSPENVSTFGGQKLLYERAYSAHLEMITNWEQAYEECKKQHLEIARKHFIEERKRVFENKAGDWETKTFTRADLQGGVTIKVEQGSSIPKSQAAEISGIFESISAGLINPMDEKVRYKILERFGQSDLMGDLEEDFKDARNEWKDFLETGAPRPRNGIDNELVHYMDAVARAKTEEFFKLPQEMQAMWEEHILYHKMNLEAQMMQNAAMQQPRQRPGQGQPARKPASKVAPAEAAA